MQKPQRPTRTTETTSRTVNSGIYAQWESMPVPSRSAPYIQPGKYLLAVKAVKSGYSDRKPGTVKFVLEAEVVQSIGEQANPIGTMVSRPLYLNKPANMNESRNITAAIYGIDEHDVNAEDGVAVTKGDGEDVVDTIIYCEAYEKPWAAPDGTIINFVNCHYLPGDHPAANIFS